MNNEELTEAIKIIAYVLHNIIIDNKLDLIPETDDNDVDYRYKLYELSQYKYEKGDEKNG